MATAKLYYAATPHEAEHAYDYSHAIHGFATGRAAYTAEYKAYGGDRDVEPVEPANEGDECHQHNDERNKPEYKTEKLKHNLVIDATI